MKLLGVTQGSNLRVFLRLAELLKEPLGLSSVSAYVADSQAFQVMSSNDLELLDKGRNCLKEWDITREGLKRQPDWAALRAWEERLGDPVLWNALLADRRIFFGRRCKQRQDYRPRFTHAQMFAIAQTAIEMIEAFLDQHAPDVVLGFGTSTFGDYLLYRCARTRKIPYLQLKATKVANYVSLNDDAIALSAHIANLIAEPESIPDAAYDIARTHLAKIRERGVLYEGALSTTVRFQPLRGLVALLRGLVRDARNAMDPVISRDNHVENVSLNGLYAHIIQPARHAWVAWRLKGLLLDQAGLAEQVPFVFYPLHFEPEVSLQVFGRPFQNQIEVVRNLALNIPAGMQVLVKEHPRALGFRPLGYYRRLLEIPNVRLVDPRLATHQVVRQANLVAVISGSTGFEAAVLGKPVIIFGTPTYAGLSSDMVRAVGSLHELGAEIRALLSGYRRDEAELERFIAAHVAGSVPVDLYSTLLAKPNRHSEGREGLSIDVRARDDLDNLTAYATRRIQEITTGTVCAHGQRA
jgi:hypothetical protein